MRDRGWLRHSLPMRTRTEAMVKEAPGRPRKTAADEKRSEELRQMVREDIKAQRQLIEKLRRKLN